MEINPDNKKVNAKTNKAIFKISKNRRIKNKKFGIYFFNFKL